ncbi:MAG: endonuclease [Anaerolineae bacterium]|nr:endonuclease [Anaerolineae bacterium]
MSAPVVFAQTAVFVNEIHYDNVGTDTGEAIEIAGPAGTDLTGWSIVLYNGNGGAVYDTDYLSVVIPDQQAGYGTVVINYPVNGIQNGSPDGLALVDASNGVIQFLSYEGVFTAVGGPADGMTSTDIGVAEGSGTAVGDSLQLTGSGFVYEDFTWIAPQPNTFGAVNTGQSFGGVVNAPVMVDCGSWLNTYEGNPASRAVSASDADGTVVAMSIDVSPVPASGTITLQNFVAAAAPGETATGDVVVDADVPAGIYAVTVTATNDDLEPQEGTCSFNVDVDPFLTIGEVQGVVEDTDFGTSHDSPYEGEYVAIQGVIYEKTQEFRSSGGAYYGFFLQNTAATADGDPLSSDGIFVFHDRFSTLRVDGGGYYEPQIGDEVILRGPVQERFQNTRLNNPYLIQVVRSGVDLDAEIPAFEVDPPAAIVDDMTFDDIQDAYRYWERHEGMRAQVPAGSTVLNGRDVFASTFDSEIWVARPDSLIAQRADPYERRSFRDMHPLDDIPTVGFDNDNPYRILMGTFGLKAAMDDTTALLAPARTYDTLTGAVIGGIYFNFGKYSVQVEEQIQLVHGVDPSLNNPPPALDRGIEYSVAVFNVENLYDFVDDPFDGCDFVGNAGCPGVSPPFDYVPPNDGVYQERLEQIALQIIQDLHAPDIVLVQEAEDQDICLIDAGEYECGDVNDADGKPDALQELAELIESLGGPAYDAAFDRDGADDRGIISAYLFRSARVELLPAMADDPVLGSDPQVFYPDGEPFDYNSDVQNPKVLNAVLPYYVTGPTDGPNVFTRPPQVANFRIWRTGIGESVYQDIYLSNNHFSSGPDNRVGQRTEQALYNARIVKALQAVDPLVYVGVGGDLNVYPRPDDPFLPPDTSDQLGALYDVSLVNLWDIMVGEDPVSAFSYVYQGQTQTLDQMFNSPSWLPELAQANMAHINADFPADYPGDGPRGTSDHDPVLAGYGLEPTLARLEALVYYYDANGEITGNQTTRILLDRLERARRFMGNGQQDAYEDQLRAFISQIWDFTPQFITERAAQVLEQETTWLLSMP